MRGSSLCAVSAQVLCGLGLCSTWRFTELFQYLQPHTDGRREKCCLQERCSPGCSTSGGSLVSLPGSSSSQDATGFVSCEKVESSFMISANALCGNDRHTEHMTYGDVKDCETVKKIVTRVSPLFLCVSASQGKCSELLQSVARSTTG